VRGKMLAGEGKMRSFTLKKLEVIILRSVTQHPHVTLLIGIDEGFDFKAILILTNFFLE
jgi:hypothetical protein